MDLKLTTIVDAENPVLHDLHLKNGDLVWFSDEDFAEEVAQNLRIRFWFVAGEWTLDEREGFPYSKYVFIKSPSQVVIKDLCRQTLLSTPGVAEIISLDVDIDTSSRVASVDFNVRLTNGLSVSDYVALGPYILEINRGG